MDVNGSSSKWKISLIRLLLIMPVKSQTCFKNSFHICKYHDDWAHFAISRGVLCLLFYDYDKNSIIVENRRERVSVGFLFSKSIIFVILFII